MSERSLFWALVGRRMATAVTGGLMAVAALGPSGVRGQQLTIESLPLASAYGNGVHGFFSGAYERAYEDLSTVIDAGSTDPRAWYFRGLAALQLGRSDEAEADFAEGARRESDPRAGVWPVARSLERVQGNARLQLERHRTRARVSMLQRDRAARQRRYTEFEEAQPDVLRRRRPEGPLTSPPAGEDNPFEEQRPPRMPEPAPVPEPLPPAEQPPAIPAPSPELEPELEPAPKPKPALPAESEEDPFK
jgi:tetratricopeptide (TPR) repeat protein